MEKEQIEAIVEQLKAMQQPTGQYEYYEAGYNSGLSEAIELLEEALDLSPETAIL
jgi:hypothetical protein